MYVRQVTDLSTRLDRANLMAGTTLGRYRLVDRIGEGGMGEVWKAYDANLDRDVVNPTRSRATIDVP